MSMSRMTCLSLLFAAGSAFAHPGHGKPGFLHSHTWAQLADGLANAALLCLLLFAAGAAIWFLDSMLRRKRK